MTVAHVLADHRADPLIQLSHCVIRIPRTRLGLFEQHLVSSSPATVRLMNPPLPQPIQMSDRDLAPALHTAGRRSRAIPAVKRAYLCRRDNALALFLLLSSFRKSFAIAPKFLINREKVRAFGYHCAHLLRFTPVILAEEHDVRFLHEVVAGERNLVGLGDLGP